jgi:streptomycin 6-kinase
MVTPLDGFIYSTRARIGDEARPWLSRIATLQRELTARGELELEDPIAGGATAYTIPATRGGREAVVLRISYPDGWFAEETRALLEFDGRGVVELIDHDERGAHLLERAVPGTSALDLDEADGDEAAAAVLEQLWEPAPDAGFTDVADEVGRWAESMPTRFIELMSPFERPLADLAAEKLHDLAGSQQERLLLHGDLTHRNLLAAERLPWLAIDPKPLVGERAFDVASLMRDRLEDVLADEDPVSRLQRRLDLLSERLGCDRERLREWSFATTIDYALWDYEMRLRDSGRMRVQLARFLRALEV